MGDLRRLHDDGSRGYDVDVVSDTLRIVPMKAATTPRDPSEWRFLFLLALFLLLVATASLVSDLKLLAGLLLVGTPMISFVAGYLYRAKLVQERRRPPSFLRTPADSD